MRHTRAWLALLALACGSSGCGGSGSTTPQPSTDAAPGGPGTPAPKCEQHDPLRQVFFGDTHVHTALSLDANLNGTRLRPAEAYAFARGEEVGIQPHDATGRPLRRLQLARPLDFMALSDHAEYLGLVRTCEDTAAEGNGHDNCTSFREDPAQAFTVFNVQLALPAESAMAVEPCDDASGGCRAASAAAWQETIDAAAEANDASAACRFTSFVGYEWSASPSTQNLHRNVIFRNDRVPDVATSYFDAGQVEQLWDALERNCLDADNGCDVLTIPHNSNLSGQLMFREVDSAGEPMSERYAARRARFEPLVELFQHKGDSECMPGSTAADELCGFEKVPYETLGRASTGGPPLPLRPQNFVRHALGRGLALGDMLGSNPFKYGFIGSTDTHHATGGAVREKDFAGHGGAGKPIRDALPEGLTDRIYFNPGGLAGVWAEENSREAIFEAMRRRETYATSGPRITLRLFGGWDLPRDLCSRNDLVERGYAGGVPMGGDLPPPPEPTGVPHFVVSAQRDPGVEGQRGVPLQRIQLIKGWLDGTGKTRLEVLDVAGDPSRPVGVDDTTCEPFGPGDDALCAVWSDEAFDPALPAFYYARVLENPSCRWHTHACNAAGVRCDEPSTVPEALAPCCDEAYPRTQQERAWSSPIWHRSP